MPADVPLAALRPSVVATALAAARFQVWPVSCFASDGGGWIVCSAGKSADRQEPNAFRSRQDLAPRRRLDPDDVVGVQLVPVAVDLHVGRAAQRDIDLLLAELVGGRIPGPLGRVVMLWVGVR